MNRPQAVFVTAIFTAVLTGYCVERSRPVDPTAEFDFVVPGRVTFAPLEPPGGEHALRGVVRTGDGDPAIEVQVFLFSKDLPRGVAPPLLWTFTDENGRFALEGVPAGELQAVLSQPGFPNTLVPVRIPDETDVAWTLDEPHPPIESLPAIERASLLGRLRPPVGFAESEVDLAGYDVVVRPADGAELLSGAITRRTTTDEAGFFFLDDVVAGDYEVQVLPPWATGGSWPVLDRVQYEHSPFRTLVEILPVRLRCGELVGRLVDLEGRDLEGALVQVWPRGQDRRPWPPEQTDARGSFLVPHLPPGQYRVRVQAGASVVEKLVTVQIATRVDVAFEPLDPRSDG